MTKYKKSAGGFGGARTQTSKTKPSFDRALGATLRKFSRPLLNTIEEPRRPTKKNQLVDTAVPARQLQKQNRHSIARSVRRLGYFPEPS